jgi:hypothetical protein
MLGSMSIAVNSLTGPAMLALPATFRRSGIVPTCTCILFVCALSALCCLHMSNTISKCPGNATFTKEIEYSQAFCIYWGRSWLLITQVLFFCCITCLNISSIVDVAQVIDSFLGHWNASNGGTIALQILSLSNARIMQWDYSACDEIDIVRGMCLPYAGANGLLITAGNIAATCIFMPLALMDLKENSSWQIIGFVVLIITSIFFVIQFCIKGLNWNHLTWWGDDYDDLFGVVVFNFALVIAIPAWLYEREPHVNVATVIHSSSILAAVLYIVIGLLGSCAMPHASSNMLESMMSGRAFGPSMELGTTIFAMAIIGLGSPLFSVLTRLNLTGSGLCDRKTANVLAVYLPFAVSWLLYDGSQVTKMLSWGGVVFTALVAFILPILLTIYVVREIDGVGSVPVYCGWFTSKRAETVSLYILLILTAASIAAAIAGNVIP